MDLSLISSSIYFSYLFIFIVYLLKIFHLGTLEEKLREERDSVLFTDVSPVPKTLLIEGAQ